MLAVVALWVGVCSRVGLVTSTTTTSNLRVDHSLREASVAAPASWFSSCATEYKQMFTNQYVSDTQQIDWKCVSVTPCMQKESQTLRISMRYWMHANPLLLASVQETFDVIPVNGTILLIKEGSSSSTQILSYASSWTEDSDPEVIVFTGKDSPAVYVWAKNALQFMVDGYQKVYSFLNSNGLLDPSNYLLHVIPTYDPLLCSL